MSSNLILYCSDGSPPVRAVYLCLEALSLPHQRKIVNVLQREQFTPEFLKMNPQHTVPTLDDSGVMIWDSHAINAYLFSLFTSKNKEIATEYRKEAAKAYNLLEKFLEGQNFVAGDNFTIADFSCIATVSTFVEAFGITAEAHPRVKSWLQRCKEVLPGYKTSQERGIRSYQSIIDRVLNRNQSKL